MGLLDWLSDGLGSAIGGSGAAPMVDATNNYQSPGSAPLGPDEMPPSAMPSTPPNPLANAPLPAGTDPMTAGGTPSEGPGLPTPLPAPRPPGADAIPSTTPPNAAPTSGVGAPTSLSPSDANGVIKSYEAAGGHAFAPGPNADLKPATGFLGRALGLDENRERSVKGALGAGFKAAGNSAGKSPFQALASGAGEGLEGGQKAADTGYDQRLKSLQLAVAAQSAGDKSAYNKNYAEYLKGKLEQDTNKVSGGGKAGAWNKPDSQKFIDAQNALAKDRDIVASQKLLEKTAADNGTSMTNKDGSPSDLAIAKQAHDKLVQQKQGMYLSGVGLDPAKIQANIQNPPGTPQNPHVITSKQDFETYVKPGQAYKNPADGKIYIRKGEAGAEQAAPSPVAPPMPAEPAEPE